MANLLVLFAQGTIVKVFQSKHVFPFTILQIRRVHDSTSKDIWKENVGNHKTCFEFEVRIPLQAILFLCKTDYRREETNTKML